MRGDDEVRVGGAPVVDVVDARNLRRLVDAQPLRAVQSVEQRQTAQGRSLYLISCEH